MYKTNRSNTIMTADVNARYQLWYALTKGHIGELIE